MANNNFRKNLLLFIVAILIGGSIWYLESTRAHVGAGNVQVVSLAQGANATTTATTLSATDIAKIRAEKALQYKPAVEIVNPSGFINTGDDPATGTGQPIKIADYIGKDVILIDFMTYSCINCQRTFPYTTAWYGKYKDQGFVVIGIHTPEFEFEKVYANVKQEMARYGIKYPVVMDNNYGTWTAYGNQYWPREYLIDIDGYIREDHIGEGGYQDTEKMIQTLIDERDQRLGITPTFDTAFVNPTGVVTSIQTNSPETYFGSNRNEYLGNGTKSQAGVQSFTLQHDSSSPFLLNTLYLGGYWNVMGEYAQSQSSTASFVYKYDAMNVYFVAAADTPVVAEVTLDGKSVPANMRGSDVYENNGKTYVKVGESRLYNIISGSAMETHTLQINAQSSGLKAFTLTFG